MALILLEGFETTNTVDGGWGAASMNNMSWVSSNMRTGAGAMQSVNGSGQPSWSYAIPVADRTSKMWFGCAFTGAEAGSAEHPMYLSSGAAVVGTRVGAGPVASITIGGTIVATSAIIVLSGWNYWELEVEVGTPGRAALWINGVQVTEYIGNIAGTELTSCGLRYGAGSSGTGKRWDDIYLCNDVGPAPHNGRLGDIQIYPILPTSDASVSFTPSTGGSNAALVDEMPHNSDTDYVYADTPGVTDLYHFTDLSVSDVEVVGVRMRSVARKVGTEPVAVEIVADSDGSQAVSPEQALGTSYSANSLLFPTDPDSGALWTPTSFDAAKFGVRVKEIE